jgi:hypothetical protein
MSAKKLDAEEIDYLNEIKLIGSLGFGIFTAFTENLPSYAGIKEGMSTIHSAWSNRNHVLLNYSCVFDENTPVLSIDNKTLVPITLVVSVDSDTPSKYEIPLSTGCIDSKAFEDLNIKYPSCRGNPGWRQYSVIQDIISKGIPLKFFVCEENSFLYVFSNKRNELFVLAKDSLTEHTNMFSIVSKKDCISFIDDFHILVQTPEDIVEATAQSADISRTPNENKDIYDQEEVSDLIYENRTVLVEGQEDGLIDESDLENEALTYMCGSEEQLERDTTLVFHALFPLAYWEKYIDSECSVVYRSATDDGNEAYFDMEPSEWDNELLSTGLEDSPHRDTVKSVLTDALTVVVSENQPQGHSWEYNDGPYDRQSGYDKEAHRIEVNVTPPSAHEQVTAKLELSKRANVFSKELLDRIEKAYTLLNNE